MGRREVLFYHWLARRLPRKIVYFCGMNIMCHATSGKYENTVVPELTGMDALRRFEKDYNIG